MKCRCGYTIDYELPRTGYNVGDAMKMSGFIPIFEAQGHIIWLCPTCYKKAKELTQELYDLIGAKWIYLESLLHEVDRT